MSVVGLKNMLIIHSSYTSMNIPQLGVNAIRVLLVDKDAKIIFFYIFYFG